MKIKPIFTALAAALLIHCASAQNNTVSPYSTRGFGESEAFINAFSRSLGGAINGIRTSRTVSFSNPASFAALRYVSLDFGFRADYAKTYSELAAKTQYNGNFNYIGLAFPVLKKLIILDTSKNKSNSENKLYREYRTRWSVGFGLTPYSNINVAYTKIQDTTYGQLYNLYNKRGGLSRFYLVNAVNLSPNLSIGLNTSLLFGQSKSNQAYYLLDTGTSRATFQENNIQMRGFRFDFGLQGERNRDTIVRRDSVFEGGKMVYKTYRYPLRFVFGATVSNNTSLRYDVFRQVINRSVLYGTNRADTVLTEENISGNTTLPLSYSAGISVTFNRLWMLTADYRKELLSKMDGNLFQDSFGNSSQISLGFAYRPDADIEMSEQLKSKRKANLEYRFGFRLLNTGYLFKDNTGKINPLKEYGISFGIGIPKTRVEWDVKSKVLLKSLFNITAEYVHRGNTNNGMIAENLYRLTIGFTLSDIWFKQRKFY